MFSLKPQRAAADRKQVVHGTEQLTLNASILMHLQILQGAYTLLKIWPS
jgi:hypothetical protein